MAERLRLFILAGEPSGDRLAADLIRRLKGRVELAFSGVGGDEMQAEGLRSLFPMSDLAVMGITDVFRRLPLLLWRIEQTARAIRRGNPDIVVLVDAQDFSRLLAKRLKRMGFRGRMILYVAPTVWARAPERAAKLRPLFDEVMTILPFEPAVLAKLGGPPATYVGHPALAEQEQRQAATGSGPLILMPGSRSGELQRHLPLFQRVVADLRNHPNVGEVVVPTLRSMAEPMRFRLAQWSFPVTVVSERPERHAYYRDALAALVVSGTATLELALARVPMVVTYVMDAHQARTYDKLGRPPVSLPNIILGRSIVPELVLASPDGNDVRAALGALIDSEKARHDQIAAFDELARKMETGEPNYPRQDPADRILTHWIKA